MTVTYEWDVETVQSVDTVDAAKGDVLNHFFQTSYAGALAQAKETPEPGTTWEVVLVRDDDNGRSWAYVDPVKGEFLSEFQDSYGVQVAKVPKRFLSEVERAHRPIA